MYHFEEEANIISLPEDGYVPNPKGLGWELFEAMKKFKDNIGQVSKEIKRNNILLDYF